MPDGGMGMPTLATLAALPRWVAWQTQDRKGKPTKLPYAASGSMAKADDPATWCGRAEAEDRAALLPKPYGTGGTGIMLGDHQGLAIGGIDLDTCRDDAGDLTEWADEVLARFNSYAEVSPSGTGVKLFFTFDGATLAELRRAMGSEHGRQFKRATGKDHPPAVELYLGNRYFAATDQRLDGAPAELRRVDTDTLLWLVQEFGPAFARVANRQPAERQQGAGTPPRRGAGDGSRSALAFSIACGVKREGGSDADVVAALEADRQAAAWLEDKGRASGGRELRRLLEKAGKIAASPAWLAKCQKTSEGDARGNVLNAVLALREDPRINGVFRQDEMLRAPVLLDKGEMRAVTDIDVSRLQVFLQREGLETLAKDVTHQAVAMRAAENGFHPVRDYLNNLRWDSKRRIHEWLHTYFGAEAGPYAARVGTMFLVAMVARVFEPGCKADYMVVLEGPQGLKKSTACRILGGAWFSDCLPDLDRDAVRVAQHIRGKWLIEIAEMSAVKKSESEALKAFITRPVEQFTPKYGRLEVTEPRQCVFIGTTNKDNYLQDETGGRRYWPVKVSRIDIDALAQDRDQLFAEAVYLYRLKTQWWPDADFENAQLAPAQERRREVDAWEDIIEAFLRDKIQVTVAQVALQALNLETGKLGTTEQRRISRALMRLKWVRGAIVMGIPTLDARGGQGERYFIPENSVVVRKGAAA